MRLVNISEVLTYEKDEAVPAVRGTLVSCYSRKETNSAEYGPGSYQGGTIADATGKITVMFKNRDSVSAFKGKVIEITGGEKQKGLKVGWYNGAPQLIVTASAEVYDAQNGSDVTDVAPKTPQNAPQPAAPAQQGKESGKGSNAPITDPGASNSEPTGVDELMTTLYRVANVQIAAFGVITEYVIPHLQAKGLLPEDVDPVTVAKLHQNMCIEAYRKGGMLAPSKAYPIKKKDKQ